MLRLQDLTHEDIPDNVKGKLVDHESFSQTAEQDSNRAQIVHDVTDKAQGVFLWVFLVVREFLKSPGNGDGLYDLQRNVQQMPSKLETYFRPMFHTIDDIYEKQTAQIFLVCTRSRYLLSLLAFCIFEANHPLADRVCGIGVLQQ